MQNLADELCPQTIKLEPPVTLYHDFLTTELQAKLWQEVLLCPLEQIQVKVFGKQHYIPRQQLWMADDGCDYQYSSQRIAPYPWTPRLLELRQQLLQQLNIDCNSVLINHYRDGHDCMGWHSDNEPELDEDTAIVSVSLGATRDFFVRHKETKANYSYALSAGDVLVMAAGMQSIWQHSLPKRLKIKESRINLTFRKITPYYYSPS